MVNTDATISYLQGCVDSKDDELYRVKGVRNELQDKCDALTAENAKLREALTDIAGGFGTAPSLDARCLASKARAALEETK